MGNRSKSEQAFCDGEIVDWCPLLSSWDICRPPGLCCISLPSPPLMRSFGPSLHGRTCSVDVNWNYRGEHSADVSYKVAGAS
jgi:hypothetical protein